MNYFQSRDLEDRETQEAKCLYVCLSVCISQTLIRFYSMNSSVNSFLEWQLWLDIHGSDLDLKNLIKSLAKWLKFKKLRLRFNSMNSFVNSFMIFSNIQIIKMSDIFRKFVNILNGWYIQLNLRMNSNEFIDEF